MKKYWKNNKLQLYITKFCNIYCIKKFENNLGFTRIIILSGYIIMASLDEAFKNIGEEKTNVNINRSFKSILKEREKEIKPFTQKQNEENGNHFLDKNTHNFPIKK